MRSRARSIRVILALVNVICAVVTLGIGAILLIDHERHRAASPQRPHRIPEPSHPGWSLLDAEARPVAAPTPPARTSAMEDAMVLADAPTDFRENYRVVFASTDGDPRGRMCIVSRGWEQHTLVPGERLGGFVLTAIEPLAGEPRSVRLRFRELRRDEEVVVLLRADP